MKEVIFKGRTSILMENQRIRVIVLPELGGKVASFYHKEKNFELLFQNKESFYKKPALYSNFAQFDASGFDDCFPSVASSIVNYNGQTIIYPDHGEIWSAEFDYIISGQQLVLIYNSQILPYKYEKKMALVENTLRLTYRIINTGNEQIKCIWAMHCLLNYHEDMEIIFPTGVTEVVNVLDGILSSEGTVHDFPVTQTSNGRKLRLDRVLPADSHTCIKYYLKNKVEKGDCGIYYPSNNTLLRINYNSKVLPYLGFWLTAGGFRGDYNCALEPCNGFYDSIEKAEKENKLYHLKPSKTLEFLIDLTVS